MFDFRRYFPPTRSNTRAFLLWIAVVVVAGTVMFVFDLGRRPNTPRGIALERADEREAITEARRAREAVERADAEQRSAEARRRLREGQRAEDTAKTEDWEPTRAPGAMPAPAPSSGRR